MRPTKYFEPIGNGTPQSPEPLVGWVGDTPSQISLSVDAVCISTSTPTELFLSLATFLYEFSVRVFLAADTS